MTDLIQPKTALDLIIAKRGCSIGYARQMLFKAVKSGKLIPYKKRLKYGTRLMNLFNPEDVVNWIDKV